MALPLAVTIALLVAGCGSSGKSQTAPQAGPGALSAEAKSAATGDIPDNQVFLTFKNGSAGYSMHYPEGWARQGSGGDLTFQDKNNLVHVVVNRGSTPTVGQVQAELAKLKQANPSFRASVPQPVTIKGAPAIKATYTTRSAPNPVTGKRVTLVVDRYELAKGGKRATVDLGTPKGVDNVDAYRLMIESFKWK